MKIKYEVSGSNSITPCPHNKTQGENRVMVGSYYCIVCGCNWRENSAKNVIDCRCDWDYKEGGKDGN